MNRALLVEEFEQRRKLMGRLSTDLQSTPFDAIIIGAGINGAGIARDAAMRGLKVLLVDKGDIGGGTSSWSTRLIHGGLRYLEHAEFGLVRESLRERETLLRIAPHLVRPLPILIPIHKDARRGPWTIRAGMIAYDLLSFDKTLPGHQMLSRAQALERAPGLESKGLVGAALYYDAQVEFAERLVLENALAAGEYGALVVTHARVDKVLVENGSACGVEFISELSGERQSAGARVLINAAGPWVDQVLEYGGAKSTRLLGGTKGSHLIVAKFPGAPSGALYTEAQADRRPFFIISWNGSYLIGTTDLRYEGDLDHVQIEEQEIDYLLRETNRLIPQANLTRDHILYTYSGVRPLPFANGRDERSITRRHFIREHPQLHGLLSIVGGKLTTYRRLAEQAVDLIFRRLGRTAPMCTTDKVPLPGAVSPDFTSFRAEFITACGLSARTSDRLLRIYGTRALEVLKLAVKDPSLADTFNQEADAVAAEVVFSFTHEMAETLADCLLRRTMMGLNSVCGLDVVDVVAKIAQQFLGWTDDQVTREKADYRKYVAQLR